MSKTSKWVFVFVSPKYLKITKLLFTTAHFDKKFFVTGGDCNPIIHAEE